MNYKDPNLGHEVILTFDDGPNLKTTPRLLDTLAKENIKGVFFVLGQQAQMKGGLDIVRRAYAEGHVIGNHTFSHANLVKLTEEQIRVEIKKTEDVIGEFLGEHKLIRPPYGAHNSTVDRVMVELGYHPVLWNVDPQDWSKAHQPDGWVQSAIDQISQRSHSVMLTHDIHATTVDNFSTFIVKARGITGVSFVQYA